MSTSSLSGAGARRRKHPGQSATHPIHARIPHATPHRTAFRSSHERQGRRSAHEEMEFGRLLARLWNGGSRSDDGGVGHLGSSTLEVPAANAPRAPTDRTLFGQGPGSWGVGAEDGVPLGRSLSAPWAERGSPQGGGPPPWGRVGTDPGSVPSRPQGGGPLPWGQCPSAPRAEVLCPGVTPSLPLGRKGTDPRAEDLRPQGTGLPPQDLGGTRTALCSPARADSERQQGEAVGWVRVRRRENGACSGIASRSGDRPRGRRTQERRSGR